MSEIANTPTIFLTGSTGLVGRYLLKELLECGASVAVLVRAEPNASAGQRIEQVLQVFEQNGDLPRPRVIAGDLTSGGLGISKQDQAWLSKRSLTVLHCAASIRFLQDDRSGEPYRTNVDGTRNLVEFLGELDVRSVHYVSTAYVGSRQSGAMVSEVPVADDRGAGNDYEKSKILAESLLRDSPWTKSLTIHRPSIVIGDSQTGFTSTYHGFYAPLQIGAQFANAYGFSSGAGNWLRSELGLDAQDSKNLVPVDWVANSIVGVVRGEKKSESGSPRILHWTNPAPVTCEVMQSAIVDSLEAHFAVLPARTAPAVAELPAVFREQMGVYESYFQNDPKFDNTNACRARPNGPCPEVGYQLLRKTAGFALSQNFGWPKTRHAELPHVDLKAGLSGLPIAVSAGKSGLQVSLLGPGAPEPLFFCKENEQWHVSECWPTQPGIVLTLRMQLLSDCIFGKTELLDAIVKGRATISGLLQTDWEALVTDWLEHVKSRIEST